jgi:hypothetical protein
MKRRDFLRSAGVASAALAFPKTGRLLSQGAVPDTWRTFELTTNVQVLKSSGTTRIWLPAALVNPTPFQKTLANEFKAEGGTAKMVESSTDTLGIIAAEFPAGVNPILTVTSRIATKYYAVDLSAAGNAPKGDQANLEHFLRPTKLLPTDGIVKTTATEIAKGAKTHVEKARAIYEWIVVNTFRNPKTRGCGLGDIRFMLETKDLGGKCADLNALFVGRARWAFRYATCTWGPGGGGGVVGSLCCAACQCGSCSNSFHKRKLRRDVGRRSWRTAMQFEIRFCRRSAIHPW